LEKVGGSTLLEKEYSVTPEKKKLKNKCTEWHTEISSGSVSFI
jgi:hypothetical protein